MSLLGREIERAAKTLERAEAKPFFTWGGQNYPCVANVAEASRLLGLGGFALEADLTIFVRLDVLPSPGPAEKQTVIYKGKTYRIDKVATLPGDSLLKLICNSPTRGA